MKIKKGDWIETPRFMKVRIEIVFKTLENARKQGYMESTDFESPVYNVYGKNMGDNRMIFAAVAKAL